MVVAAFVVSISIINGMKSEMAADNVTMPSSALALIDIMLNILVATGILSVFAGGPAVYKYVKYKKWRAFGNRMKEAYTAKFGYPNPGFNEEVDQHIKAMEVLGHGDTKHINEDWLKRMAKFVEIPYVIPEEERLSEVEKTEQYDPEYWRAGKVE